MRVCVTASKVQPKSESPVELLEACASACTRLKQQVAKVVIGQDQVVDNMLVALLARGHALLVGVPGLAKTLLVSSIARCLGLSFGRVQFTPDLLPADITGADVMSEVERSGQVRRQLSFMPGPIFKNLILADEINRTPPKTQAALLQAMQERCVTVGGDTHPLPSPFQVFATRNPIEQEGTYPLPEAQLDRFLLEIHIDYPSEDEERQIARRSTGGESPRIETVMSPDEVRAFGDLVMEIDGQERRSFPWPEWSITTVIDAKDHWRTAWEAISHHRTQLPGYEKLLALPESDHIGMWGKHLYYRVLTRVPVRSRVESDLFEGLRDQPRPADQQGSSQREQDDGGNWLVSEIRRIAAPLPAS